MTECLSIAGNNLAYEVSGQGPLVVLAHGIGDSRHSYRFLAPALVGAGYRVANVDIRGCGDSSLGWDAYSRTDIAGDLVAVVRHFGGPAVIIGQSISGGAATIAAATAPDLINGIIELAPFTRLQPFDLGGLMRVKRFRTGYSQMAQVMVNVTCPVLIIEGSLDPDWADPRAEGEKIIADLPRGLGELAIIEGAGHYPHAQTPDQVLALAQPFLDKTLANA
ncbi:alpha/beta fold hydrolase [Micromonospora sp. DT228]|uniref:alpha/beta fold hydrolase n=1 Tax=Micromonospora sp. DT228 TaxID=3393443 RepID=UPI003CEA262C